MKVVVIIVQTEQVVVMKRIVTAVEMNVLTQKTVGNLCVDVFQNALLERLENVPTYFLHLIARITTVFLAATGWKTRPAIMPG